MQQYKLEVENVPVAQLRPRDDNPRTHPKKQLDALESAIRTFGWTVPLLIDDKGGIIAGHARFEVATDRLGLRILPCVRMSGLSDAQARALVISDNRIAEMAGWDEDLLLEHMSVLVDDDFNLEATGFSFADFERMGARKEQRQEGEDDSPKLAVDSDIVYGQVIELGPHKLICGDATDPDIVSALLGREVPSLMVTDPYGVNLDANWRKNARGSQPTRAVIQNDDRADWREAWQLFLGDVAYVWHGHSFSGIVGESLEAAGFDLRAPIVWVKNRFAMSRGHYHWKHEACWYAVRKNGGGSHWNGSRKETTVWEIDIEQKLELGHPNQKPVECMRRPIRNNSNPGQLVYDPFVGTGSTLIACELTGRIARCVELDPRFCSMVVERYNQLKAKMAEHEGNGQTTMD